MRPFLPALLAAALALPVGTATAQRVLGPGPDATTIPRGALRVTLGGDHTLHRERWNDGQREPLGAGFSVAALGAPHLAAVRALNEEFAGIGVTGLNASLGETRLDLRQRVFTTRFGIEYGLTDWLMLGVEIPIVRTRAEAQLRARGDSGIATAGVNPYGLGTGVPAANRAAIDVFTNASLALTTRRDDCIANAGSAPECPQILAEAAQVDAWIAQAAQFATALAQTYGAQGLSTGLPFIPLAGSPGEMALLQLVGQMRAAFTGYGVTTITPTSGLPLGAQTPLSAEQLQAIVATNFGARPMTRAAQQSLGDIDVGVRLKVIDTFGKADSARYAASPRGVRQTFGLTYRLANGEFDDSDNFIDVGTGDGSNAIAIRSFTDVVVNRHFWTTVSLGWVQGTPYTRTVRVPALVGVEWIEPWREQTLKTAPGSLLELEIAPRWQLNDYFGIGTLWRIRGMEGGRTTMSLVPADDGYGHVDPILPRTLDAQNTWTEHRLGWSLSYSTLAAAARGRSGIAMEIGLVHEQSVAASGGVLPRRFTDRVQLRYYPRLRAR